MSDNREKNGINENNVKKSGTGKSFILALAAMFLCAAGTFSALGIAARHTGGAPSAPAEDIKPLKTADGYGDIYDTVKAFAPTFWDRVIDYAYDLGSAVNGTGQKDTELNIIEEKAESTAEGSSDYSGTTLQVEGVDEADRVKTDGRYIYILSTKNGCTVKIAGVSGGAPVQLADIKAEGIYCSDMYLSSGRLVLIGTEQDSSDTLAVIYDVNDPKAPKEAARCRQSGYYNQSRLIGKKLYILSNHSVNTQSIIKDNPASFVPSVECGDYCGAVEPSSICIYNNCERPEYTVISAYDIEDGSLAGTQSLLGGSSTVYAGTENIITCGISSVTTQVARFSIDDGKIGLKATGEISGTLLNQFSIDEYKGYFRFVTTRIKYESSQFPSDTVNVLTVLDGGLKQVSKIDDIAPGEQVYSVRFMGDTAYFVTFRQVDPLFSVDLSDPAAPEIIGSLKIPGFSDYLFPYGDGLLLGIGRNADENTGRVENMKLSMFDISDPSDVTECAKRSLVPSYSDSLYSHKATLADPGKNIIGFSAYGNCGPEYYIYSFENGQFSEKLYVPLDINSDFSRGLYIDGVFYIVSDTQILSFTLDGFAPLDTLILK